MKCPTTGASEWDHYRHYEVTLVALETGEIDVRTSVSLTLTIPSLRPFIQLITTLWLQTLWPSDQPQKGSLTVRTLQTGKELLWRHSLSLCIN